ncbi:hypothetical protein MMC20_003457 [Loxospora ochrophaea]|nr:hypothetical protein [Loxospora ochrophaea]
MTTYKIAIVGAGPAGCTLAHLLRKASIDVVVFEGEASLEARSQGGSLDLHTKSGLAALKECGLFDEFEKYARYDGEAMALADKRNKRYLALDGATSSKDSTGRPEIDRAQLRTVLTKPLSENGTIRWNHRLKSVDANGTLNFTSGTASGFDLIVGADGAWSKIRKLLTDEMPTYAGVGGFEGRIPNAAEHRPWIHKLTNKGSWMGIGDGRSAGCQQMGDGSIATGFWHAASEDWTKDYDLNDPTAIREALHREYRDWAAEYHAVIDAIDPASFEPRTLYQLPTGLTWESKPGFTVIGDAAHLMSPFAGEGVNCSMFDACELAAAIRKAAAEGAEGRDGLAPYVAQFEKTMRSRTAPIQHLAWQNLNDWYYHPEAPRAIIESFVIRNVVAQIGWYTRIPVTIVAYIYFFFVKWRLG